ncbi:hypothetical protein PMAYCL1PPCAC_25320, partial [Pristionchus mayeri]
FLIDDEKVYANKQYLAIHSPYFNTLFFGDFAEKGKSEMELKDVKSGEFRELLKVIYPSCKKINESSAEYLLKLADRFNIMILVDRAESFIINTSDISNLDKLRIADKYSLNGLKEHSISKLTTTKDFKAIKKSPIYDVLSADTRAILFDRLVTIAK